MSYTVICIFKSLFAFAIYRYVASHHHRRGDTLEWHRQERQPSVAAPEGDVVLCASDLCGPGGHDERGRDGAEHLGEHPRQVQASPPAGERGHQPERRLPTVSCMGKKCVAGRGEEAERHGRKSVDGAPSYLCSGVQDALQRLSNAPGPKPIHRVFLIGGASLYSECLDLPAGSGGFVDRILLTRIAEPAFDDCDVFMPDFEKQGGWRRAEHTELVQWVGAAVAEGMQDEGGVKYEFQMWVRQDL